MILQDRPRVDLLYNVDNLVIPVKKGQTPILSDFIESLDNLDIGQDVVVKIENRKAKRSLDANGYFWVLVGELAKKMNKSNIEVYRTLIYDYGTFELIGMTQEAVSEFTRKWQSNGDGWLAINVGESKSIPSFYFLRAYAGSSTYDTKQMSRLIDGTIEECKMQGIETLPKGDVERLKGEWK